MDREALLAFQNEGNAAFGAAFPPPGEVRIPEGSDPIPDCAITYNPIQIELEKGGVRSIEGAAISVPLTSVTDGWEPPETGEIIKVGEERYMMASAEGKNSARWLIRVGKQIQG